MQLTNQSEFSIVESSNRPDFVKSVNDKLNAGCRILSIKCEVSDRSHTIPSYQYMAFMVKETVLVNVPKKTVLPDFLPVKSKEFEIEYAPGDRVCYIGNSVGVSSKHLCQGGVYYVERVEGKKLKLKGIGIPFEKKFFNPYNFGL